MKTTPLIYDVGMHNGDDSAYYLARGFRVVGIEANPELCRICRRRFEAEITDKRMTVLNLGVGEAPGRARFFVNNAETQVSSLVRPAVLGKTWTQIEVDVMRLSDVIGRYGDPYYVKIDVEHYDHLVLEDLFNAGIRPPYISAEAHALEVLDWLLALSYSEFKLLPGREVGVRYRQRRERTLAGVPFDYVFPPLSSGPFGEEVDGCWLDRRGLIEALGAVGLGWVDRERLRSPCG